MTCSVERFLSVGLEVFIKMDQKYANFFSDERLHHAIKYFVAWTCQKLEKTQSCMIDETRYRNLAQNYGEFRFRNMPQLHAPLVLSLEKKLRVVTDHSSDGSNGLVKSFETPNRHRSKMSSPEGNAQRSSTRDCAADTEKEHFGRRVRSVDAQLRSDLPSGFQLFGALLDSIKKRRQEVSAVALLSPQSNFLSPNRPWRRGKLLFSKYHLKHFRRR